MHPRCCLQKWYAIGSLSGDKQGAHEHGKEHVEGTCCSRSGADAVCSTGGHGAKLARFRAEIPHSMQICLGVRVLLAVKRSAVIPNPGRALVTKDLPKLQVILARLHTPTTLAARRMMRQLRVLCQWSVHRERARGWRALPSGGWRCIGQGLLAESCEEGK